MTTTDVRTGGATDIGSVATGHVKLEAVVIPVSNADRAKEFYASLGWRLDTGAASGDARVIQFTPPGSRCSIMFGKNLTPGAPGSPYDLHLIVGDIAKARHALVGRGVAVSQVFHCPTGFSCRFRHDGDGTDDWVGAAVPDRLKHGSLVSFSDPDGNRWVLQEVTTRLSDGINPATTSFASRDDLAGALRRAAAPHAAHEATTGTADPDWPDWYAAYMVGEQESREQPW